MNGPRHDMRWVNNSPMNSIMIERNGNCWEKFYVAKPWSSWNEVTLRLRLVALNLKVQTATDRNG